MPRFFIVTRGYADFHSGQIDINHPGSLRIDPLVSLCNSTLAASLVHLQRNISLHETTVTSERSIIIDANSTITGGSFDCNSGSMQIDSSTVNKRCMPFTDPTTTCFRAHCKVEFQGETFLCNTHITADEVIIPDNSQLYNVKITANKVCLGTNVSCDTHTLIIARSISMGKSSECHGTLQISDSGELVMGDFAFISSLHFLTPNGEIIFSKGSWVEKLTTPDRVHYTLPNTPNSNIRNHIANPQLLDW